LSGTISAALATEPYHGGRHSWELGFHERDGSKGFAVLYEAVFFRVVEIIFALLAVKEWDIDVKDNTGRTALPYAAVGDHEGVVKLL